jgi:hypothetical protein
MEAAVRSENLLKYTDQFLGQGNVSRIERRSGLGSVREDLITPLTIDFVGGHVPAQPFAQRSFCLFAIRAGDLKLGKRRE